MQPVYHNYQPRLGFAWNPEFNKNLVVSAGYSINTDPEFTNPFLNAAQSAPVANAGVVCLPVSTCQRLVYQCGYSCRSPTQPAHGRESAVSTIRAYVTTNFHNPYTQTYTLGVEYQVGKSAVVSARYVGAHTVGNFQSIDANPYLLPVAEAFPNVHQSLPLSVRIQTQPGFGRPDCTYSNRAHSSIMALGLSTTDYTPT